MLIFVLRLNKKKYSSFSQLDLKLTIGIILSSEHKYHETTERHYATFAAYRYYT